jgi:hypothetical protein
MVIHVPGKYRVSFALPCQTHRGLHKASISWDNSRAHLSLHLKIVKPTAAKSTANVLARARAQAVGDDLLAMGKPGDPYSADVCALVAQHGYPEHADAAMSAPGRWLQTKCCWGRPPPPTPPRLARRPHQAKPYRRPPSSTCLMKEARVEPLAEENPLVSVLCAGVKLCQMWWR